ncbi:unnamed protein product [Cochlearia groenlandica]
MENIILGRGNRGRKSRKEIEEGNRGGFHGSFMSPTTQSVAVKRRSRRRRINRAGEILGEAVDEGNRGGFYGGIMSPTTAPGKKKAKDRSE